MLLRPLAVVALALVVGCSDQDLKGAEDGPTASDGAGDGDDGGGKDGDDGDGGDPDADGDGFPASVDCDDQDNAINPEATEVCDGVDNDCDGAVDDADDSLAGGTTAYVDGDGDGYGDDATAVQVCALGVGRVELGGDCDDANGALSPGASEVCDGGDNDCDGLVDDEDDSLDLATAGEWYADADMDGYGDAENAVVACVQPPGWVDEGTDCDDAEAAANPGATEVCDGIDNDCDGAADDADSDVDLSTVRSYYLDGDGDGYGNPTGATSACAPPVAHVADNTDCNDGIAAINPGATEVCDSLDNDCDGDIDDDDRSLDLSTATDWYADRDGDGYGRSTVSTTACVAPSGSVAVAGDCDDNDDTANPAAAELCDGVDNDCDGVTTDESGQVSFTASATGVMSDVTATVSGTSTSPAAATLASDGTLTFCDGTFYTHLDIAADVVLESAGGASSTALDGGGAGTVLTIQTNGLDVTVQDLTIQNGAAATSSSEGGGIECFAASDLTVTDVVFDNNTGEWGGGLGSAGCDVAVSGSTFTDNSAIYGGGLLASSASQLAVDSSTFDGNTASTSGGDLLVLEVDTARVEGTSFTDGTATSTAGSLFVQGSGTEKLVLSGVDIDGPSAAGAGAVFVYDATVSCEDSSSVRDASASLPGAVYVGTDGRFTSWGCDFAESTATDDNDADVFTETSAETFSDYGDTVWFSCTDAGCGGVEFTGMSGTFELELGLDTSTPVTTTNCALEWDLVGTGLSAGSLCEDCDFGFAMVATYDSAASTDDGTCTSIAEDFGATVAHAPDYGSFGYDVLLQYDASYGEWLPYWAATFDGTTLSFAYGYADEYVGSYYGYSFNATRYEYGLATVY